MMMLKQTGSVPLDSDGTPAHWRQAPHNIQAEQALLGALLLNNTVLDRIEDIVVPADFFDPLHGEIFSVATSIIQAGRVASPITLRTFFENAEPITPELTVPQYLGKLAINAAIAISVKDYAHTIHDLATRRRLIHIGEDVINAAYDPTVDQSADARIEDAEKELCALAERTGKGSQSEPLSVALKESMERIERAYRNKQELTGISTGLIDLDRVLGGFEDGGFYPAGGRTGMGKTVFLVNVAVNAARAGLPVLIFSLEMQRDRLSDRILSMASGIDGDRIRRGRLSDNEMRMLIETQKQIEHTLPLHIDHTGGLAIDQVVARARRHKRQFGTRMIMVDYIQLLAGSQRRKSDNRTNELTEITTKLKALAKELSVPIVALSQISRNVEHRDNKRPMLADLRESGSIEQDADAVLLLYREEYYLSKQLAAEPDLEKQAQLEQRMRACRGKAEIIVAKNRFGPDGVVDVAFDGPTTTFSNLVKPQHAGCYHD